MNVVMLIGNLTADPKVTYTQNNLAVASFRLAVQRIGKNEGADFINCKAFGVTAENLAKYKHKGDEIAIRGRISTDSYKNKEDKMVYTTEVIADSVEYTRGSSRSDAQRAETPSMADDIPDSFSQAEDDIPF